MNDIIKMFERIKQLTEEQLKNPKENVEKIMFHLLEELGEFSTAVCIEDGSDVKAYKVLDETSDKEAIDVFICVMSLFYARNGMTSDVISYTNKKLDKWEKNIAEGKRQNNKAMES